MAVSQIEEKILGRLAKQTAQTNALLSASLYQVLGLSVLLSRKLFRARKLRKLDNSRDPNSLQLYHHIIWLAREGLSITEAYVLPFCQNGEQGPECHVMATKLRASLYHVFCLFHNHPPVSQRGQQARDLESPTSTQRSQGAPSQSDPYLHHNELDTGNGQMSESKLPNPMPSMTPKASFVTNPYADSGSGTTPASGSAALCGASDARRTPARPPGLALIHVPEALTAASYLLPPLDFVPMTRQHFDSAQHLANSLLSATHALRLSVSLEHSAFLWDCGKEREYARRLARRTIKDVYSSSDGLDDDEFADASALVQALGGIVRQGSNDSISRSSASQQTIPATHNSKGPQPSLIIDRTIALSPAERRQQPAAISTLPYPQLAATTTVAHSHIPRSVMRTPERLSTVPEVESAEETSRATTGAAGTRPSSAAPILSPADSRLSNRSSSSHRVMTSSVTSQSDKASKRKLVEAAEERVRSRQSSIASKGGGGRGRVGRENGQGRRGSSASNRSTAAADGLSRSISGGSGSHSRQTTPPESYVRRDHKR